MSLAILTHPDCLLHEMPGHPERPERLTAVMSRIESSGIGQQTQMCEAVEVANEQVTTVHPESYLEHIVASEPSEGLIRVDPDTYMSPGSVRAARLAAGASLQATEMVLNGTVTRAFCATRPPGHHTEIAEALGFCLLNNVAIAVEHALQSPAINRVAVLDFDVHHCNGTVDIFKDREEVLVCSSFQDHFYPHRFLDFANEHIINTPLSPGTGSTTFRKAIERDWLPVVSNHKPDMIFVSAGFDAHYRDPLAQLELNDDDYNWITRHIVLLANEYSEGRLVSTLEGGYDLEGLSGGVESHLMALLA